MTSPGLSQIFERLAEWSTEEIENNIDGILQELLGHLSGEDKGYVLQAVYALLVTCLPSFPIEHADRNLLQQAMPAVQLLFQESLEGIKLRLDDGPLSDVDIADTLSSLLQVCVELLKCMERVLEYIVSHGKVDISCVPNVPKTVAVLMLQTFKHCKESEALYQGVFTTVADELGALFRQCHQVQCRFFAMMCTNINYDCTAETDIVNLVDVLQTLSEVGEHVMSLDIKTMAEHWKGYAKLIQMYLEFIRHRLNIAYPINFLCLEVSRKLEQLICQELPKDSKNVTRLIKTTSFTLKIIVKLCEQFGCGNGCLGDCHSSLYRFLVTLHRYSPPVLLAQNIDKTIVDEIERNLIIAADPLLSHVIREKDFKEEFFKYSRKVCNIASDRFPHLSLMLSVMRKITAYDAGDKDVWLGNTKESNIIGCLLEILKYSHLELSSELCFPALVKSGETPRSSDLYEALCSHCAGLVLSFNSDQFQRVECLLLDSMMDSFIWPALFCGDVWCIFARAGSSELILDQILYFADIVLSFQPMSLTERVECQIISLLIRRLCSFLGPKGKETLVNKFPPVDYPLMWQIFGVECLPTESKDSVSYNFVFNAVSQIQKFLSSKTSSVSFNQMTLSLCGLSAALDSLSSKKLSIEIQKSAIVPCIISLWQFACQGELAEHISPCNNVFAGSKWLCQLLLLLCKCTENLVQTMSNTHIIQVLNEMEKVINCCGSSLKLSLICILRSLATKTLEETPNQGLICLKISYLFACLLEDSHPLVKETTLETFEYFAHFTAHESVVAGTVGDNSAIQELVTSYLQRKAPAVESKIKILNHQDYLTFQMKIHSHHKCVAKKQRPTSPPPSEKPHKKIRLNCEDSSNLSAFLSNDLLSELVEQDVSDVIIRIGKDSMYLTSQCSYESLSLSLKDDLKKAVEELNKFIKL